MRMFMIQAQILQSLGLPRQPNISGTYTKDQIEDIRRAFSSVIPDVEEDKQLLVHAYDSKTLQALAPSCK